MPTTPDPTSASRVGLIAAQSLQKQIELLRECLNEAQAILASILQEPNEEVQNKKTVKKKKGK